MDRTETPAASPPGLLRALGTRDAALLTIGSVIGTGIFLSAGDVVRAIPDARLAIAVWLGGGLITLAGALAYGEMGTLFPRAGGPYHYLRESWGTMFAFLYGWTCLLIIMTGGIAAIAVGFGEYFGSFVPAFSGERVMWSLPFFGGTWQVRGSQIAAAIAILILTIANHFGVRLGARIQNGFTIMKLATIGALILFGLLIVGSPDESAGALAREPDVPPADSAPFHILLALSTALVAVLWTYDGWYAATFAAGEMREPVRSLPRGLIIGMIVVTVVYVALNVVYLRALSVPGLAGTSRPAEAAGVALFGSGVARLITLAVALSAFGCLAATVLYAARIYQPMAEDGVFPRAFAHIDPRWHVPTQAIWLQGIWAAGLALTGGYRALFTYTTFGGLLFHIASGLALFRLRRIRPHAERPYRAWGYPVVPGLFVLGMLVLTVSTLIAAPRESLAGLALIAAGLPAGMWWRRRNFRARVRPTLVR